MCNSSSQEAVGLNGAYGNLEIRAVSLGADRPNPEVRNFPPTHTHPPPQPRVLQPGLAPGGSGHTHTHTCTAMGLRAHGMGLLLGGVGVFFGSYCPPCQPAAGPWCCRRKLLEGCHPLKGNKRSPRPQPQKTGGGLCLPTAHPTPFLTCRAQFLLDRSV